MGRATRSSGVVVCVAVLSMVTGAQGVSAAGPFRVNAIEITQSQQVDPRWIYACASAMDGAETTLIAQRRTGVRVYITKYTDTPNIDVEGTLTLYLAGQQVWQGKSLNTMTVDQTSICADIRDTELATLNFEVPYDRLWYSLDPYTFWVAVYPVGQPTQAKYLSKVVSFDKRRPVRITGVPVEYLPNNPAVNHGTPEYSLLGTWAAGMLYGTWSLREPTGNRRYIFDPTNYVQTDEVSATAGGWCAMIDDLDEFRARRAPRPDYLYAWMKGNTAGDLGGWTCNEGVTGVGNSGTDRRSTFAHEFGHGWIGQVGHSEGVPCDSIPAPVPQRLVQTGWDVKQVVTARVKPRDMFSILNGCSNFGDNHSWASIANYRQFLTRSQVIRSGGSGNPGSSTRVRVQQEPGGFWALRYALSLETNTEAITPNTDPSNPGQLRVLDAGGTELYSTYVEAPGGSSQLGEELSSERLTIELPDLPTADRLEFYWNGILHSAMSRSANAPTIEIFEPVDGATLGSTTTVRWTVSDADGDVPISFLEYTHDGGTTVLPISKAFVGSTQVFEVDTSHLPASTGGELRIRATDGVNNTTASVGNLQLGPNHAPSVEILSPRTGDVFRAGVRPILTGAAYDAEDGELPATSLVWQSDLDGTLGTGEILEAVLSPGKHLITFMATDSDGLSTSASITIFQQ